MFHIQSSGSLVSREASTVLVAVPNVLVVFYCRNERVSVGYFLLWHFYCFFLYQLTFTVLMHIISAHPASIAHYLLSWCFFFILVAVDCNIDTCM